MISIEFLRISSQFPFFIIIITTLLILHDVKNYNMTQIVTWSIKNKFKVSEL